MPLGPRTFWMEAAFLTIIIIYGITYWIGSTTNNKLATAWYSVSRLHLANKSCVKGAGAPRPPARQLLERHSS